MNELIFENEKKISDEIINELFVNACSLKRTQSVIEMIVNWFIKHDADENHQKVIYRQIQPVI